MNVQTRTCGRCHKTKPAADFYPASCNSWCRQCNKEYHRQRYAHAKAFGRTFKPKSVNA